MSYRKTEFAPEVFYHIYNRGNSKQKIFHDKQDYERFISLLFLANTENKFNFSNILRDDRLCEIDRGRHLVEIGGYCLMPNHFHLLITEIEEGGITRFMQKLSTGYVMYYNQKYKRTGSLFEGKFKSEHLGNNRYLKYIFSYIHLNPVKLIDRLWKEKGIKDKKRAMDFLETYTYSSYLFYKNGTNNPGNIITKGSFPDYFPTSKSFNKEILDWITYSV